MEKMKWTYEKVKRYAECQRRRARRAGCQRCGKHTVVLELIGRPSLTRLVQGGYGIERVREAMNTRGWFCRGCVRGYTTKERETEVREWKQKQQVLARATQEATQRQECEKFVDQAPEYAVSLPRKEYVDQMMGHLASRMASDVEEAFFLVTAEVTGK